MSYCCAVCGCVSHFIGALSWFAVTGASYNSCDTFTNNGSSPDICAGSGISNTIFLMVSIPLIVILYSVVACKAYRARVDIEFNQPEAGMNIIPSAIVVPNNMSNPVISYPRLPQYIPVANPQYWLNQPGFYPGMTNYAQPPFPTVVYPPLNNCPEDIQNSNEERRPSTENLDDEKNPSINYYPPINKS